jgi:hypothetical protein
MRFYYFLLLVSILVSCREEEIQQISEWKSKNQPILIGNNAFKKWALDTFSYASISGDTIQIEGKGFISNDSKSVKIKTLENEYITLERGQFEISTRVGDPFLVVMSGKGRLETKKVRIDIEAGNQLKIIQGNFVLVPISRSYTPNWLPDSLYYLK